MVLPLLEGRSDDEWDAPKADLTEHLAELRTRVIRSCLYLALGMFVMYVFSGPLYHVLAAPIAGPLERLRRTHPGALSLPSGAFVFHNFWEPFFLKLQISMVGGLILAAPVVLLELWGFVAPGLTPVERRGVYLVAPLSVVLFVLGVGCAFLVLPMAVHWFLGYLNDVPNVVLLQNPLTYIVFVVKMLLVFGLMFQLPVVLMFLGKVGILSSDIMKRYWRHISVGLFTVAMVVAPSNDPGTMLALAIPLTLLFFGSIWLVKLVEPKDRPA